MILANISINRGDWDYRPDEVPPLDGLLPDVSPPVSGGLGVALSSVRI